MVRDIHPGEGSYKKGKLIYIANGIIRVECHAVASKEEDQDEICRDCYWHNHPKRTEGYNLSCKMF